MQNGGWIKLYRKMTEWEWYTEPKTAWLFVHLILTANHKDSKWRGKTIKRGQKLTSLRKLSEETGLSVRSVRTSIERLKSTGELTSEANNQNRIITVNNYEKYQPTKDERQASSQASDKQATNQHVKKGKKGKNNKKGPPTGEPSSPEEITGDHVSEIIYQFQHVNPSYELLYSRKPQRQAAERLIKKRGYEKLKQLVQSLEATNAQPYAPTITTPYQLERDLGRLKAWYDKESNKRKQKGKKIVTS